MDADRRERWNPSQQREPPIQRRTWRPGSSLSSPIAAAPAPSMAQSANYSASSVRELPVFTFPNSLNFFAEEKDSLRQILTIYNPYDFPLKFRVYSTAPKLYSVTDAQGTVKPGFCCDIVIRHNAPVASNFGHSDKFRIQIYESLNSSSSNQAVGALLGKKTIESVLLERRPNSCGAMGESMEDDGDGEFSQFPPVPSSSMSSSTHSRTKNISGPIPAQWQPNRRPVVYPQMLPGGGQFSTPSPLILLLGILCISALCLPTENSTINSQFPVYLHLSFNQKLVAAYILGLVTMVILRT